MPDKIATILFKISLLIPGMSMTFGCFAMLWLASCSLSSSIQSPKAEEGVLDLRQWNFDAQGNVALNGEWAFYWQQLLQDQDFATASTTPTRSGFIKVPSVWNGFLTNNHAPPLSGDGYATYRLTVRINRKSKMALKIGTVSSAAIIYVDDQKIYEAGQVGTTQHSMQPAFRPDFVWFEPRHETFDIYIQASNFHYRKGGAWNLILLGKADHIKEAWFKANGIDFFLIGSILLMAFYHFVLFIFRKKNKAALFFSLFCATIALRIATTDNNLIAHFADISWTWLIRFEFISFFLAVALFIQFFAALFDNLFPGKLLKTLWAVALVLSLVVAVAQPAVFSYTSPPYQIIALVAVTYTFYLAVVARRKRLSGSLPFLLGYVVLLATFINDLLYVNDLTATGYTSSFGLIGFILFQTFILSKRFSQAFNIQEKLNETLQTQNQKIEAQNITLKQLNDELDIFVYRTSHDLRAPISSVLGLIQLMRMEKEQHNIEKYIGLQEKSLLKLDGFIQDILHYSRNSRLELEPEEVDFHNMLEEVFTLFSHMAHFDKIKKPVAVSQTDVFFNDAKRLTIIFNNLISNAIRYCNTSQPEPFVKVEIVVNSSEANITISDNGRGIGEEHLDKIFNMFYRASEDAKGSGLGLFLVRETVYKLKGEVRVSSQLHQGTQFFLKIPNLKSTDIKNKQAGEG